MKKSIYIFTTMLALLLIATSCYDRDVLDSKEGTSIPSVNNLKYEVTGSELKLSWAFPDNISSEFNRPLEVYIQLYEGNTLKRINLFSEETSYTYDAYNADEKYRAIVKIKGFLKEVEVGQSREIISESRIVHVE